MKKNKLLALLVPLMTLSSCKGVKVDVTTFDMQKDYGKIKLSSQKKGEDVTPEITKVVTKYNNLTSYKAKYYMYYYDMSAKEKPLLCVEAEITFSSTSYLIKSEQTRGIGDGALAPEKTVRYIYSGGTDTYESHDYENWEKVSSLKSFAKPTLYAYSYTSADLRSGKNSGMQIMEQRLIRDDQSQVHVVRFVAENYRIKYYYEHVGFNKNFFAYEFIYPEDGQEFRVNKPSTLKL